MTGFRWWVGALCLAACGVGWGQAGQDGTLSRVNTWTVFGGYSNDSSRILLGNEINRKIGAVGFGYERRLFHGRSLDLSYAAEWRPGMLQSDPANNISTLVVTAQGSTNYTNSHWTPVDKCVAGTSVYVPTPGDLDLAVYTTTHCGRRVVVEQGISPLGLRLHVLTRRRVQPTFSARIGVLLASQPVPVAVDANFNVFFDIGAGIEVYRGAARSLRLEYAVQHYGSLGTVPNDGYNTNPGVDNGFVKVTFTFGRAK